MHELGIVDHVIKQVEIIARDQHIDRIAGVSLEFGEVSGIVPEYLEKCWNWMVKRDHPVLQDASFKWEITPALTYCECCDKTYPTVRYGKTCPYCGGGDTWLLEGNGISIKNILAYEG